ncbi:hypothetical protein Peur_062139 [Populus x canadensis]
MVTLTAGREGKRRRKQGRSARFRHQRPPVMVACWNTRRQRSCTNFCSSWSISLAISGVLRTIL